jgi:hypothetical protein
MANASFSLAMKNIFTLSVVEGFGDSVVFGYWYNNLYWETEKCDLT